MENIYSNCCYAVFAGGCGVAIMHSRNCAHYGEAKAVILATRNSRRVNTVEAIKNMWKRFLWDRSPDVAYENV